MADWIVIEIMALAGLIFLVWLVSLVARDMQQVDDNEKDIERWLDEGEKHHDNT